MPLPCQSPIKMGTFLAKMTCAADVEYSMYPRLCPIHSGQIEPLPVPFRGAPRFCLRMGANRRSMRSPIDTAQSAIKNMWVMRSSIDIR